MNEEGDIVLTYRQEGDYLVPNIAPPTPPNVSHWGTKHLIYMKEHDNSTYMTMWTEGTLNDYLEDIDRQAIEMEETLTKQMAKARGVTEQLKATDQMRWVGMMNNIKSSVREIILNDLIYT
ncbi:MAG: TnpV protein [Oscillospiraceae bacterium]